MSLILIVDDDADIRTIIRFALENAGYKIIEAANGLQALEQWRNHHPALIILDILMPEMDGLDTCRRIRQDSDVPIIFLSSRDDEIDRILGLEMGGDDYVTKPFSPRELAARVKAVMRRLNTRRTKDDDHVQVLRFGRITLDTDQFKVFLDTNEEIVLTVTEFGVLKTLMRYPGKVFSRDALILGAYREPVFVSDRTIDSHINRIRRKFQRFSINPIETVHGLGYKCGDTN